MAKSNIALKFLEGAVAGVALGVAASMFMSSKKGKEVKDNVANLMAEFYKYIAPKIKKVEKMGEKEYKDFMKNAVLQFAKTKKLTEDITKDLAKDAQASWKHFSKHLGK